MHLIHEHPINLRTHFRNSAKQAGTHNIKKRFFQQGRELTGKANTCKYQQEGNKKKKQTIHENV